VINHIENKSEYWVSGPIKRVDIDGQTISMKKGAALGVDLYLNHELLGRISDIGAAYITAYATYRGNKLVFIQKEAPTGANEEIELLIINNKGNTFIHKKIFYSHTEINPKYVKSSGCNYYFSTEGIGKAYRYTYVYNFNTNQIAEIQKTKINAFEKVVMLNYNQQIVSLHGKVKKIQSSHPWNSYYILNLKHHEIITGSECMNKYSIKKLQIYSNNAAIKYINNGYRQYYANLICPMSGPIIEEIWH
jgi:hypothetical protein